MKFPNTYSFLILSLLLWIPVVLILFFRADLRRTIKLSLPFSLPFAFTETLFVPNYWNPKFLFDLQSKIGFGLEDILFVTGLGGLVVTAYPLVFRVYLDLVLPNYRILFKRLLFPLLVFPLILGYFVQLRQSILVASLVCMTLFAFQILIARKDLAPSMFWGSILISLYYHAILVLLESLFPTIFITVWNKKALTGFELFGVPFEEVTYSFVAGLVGTGFLPYLCGSAWKIRITNIQLLGKVRTD